MILLKLLDLITMCNETIEIIMYLLLLKLRYVFVMLQIKLCYI